jgi:hypothetical protein
LRILRDVIVFQVKCGLEAVLDVTLIPISLGAALLDLVFGNWRRPHLFHAVLRNLETVLRNPRTGPESVRTLRRWAALKLVGDDTAQLQPPARKEDGG